MLQRGSPDVTSSSVAGTRDLWVDLVLPTGRVSASLKFAEPPAPIQPCALVVVGDDEAAHCGATVVYVEVLEGPVEEPGPPLFP